MKHFVGIPLFLLALPMVAAEAPMSYVRVIEPDPLALSLRLLRKQPCMQRGFGCILLLLFSFLVVPTGDVKGIEPWPTYLSDGSRPCYYCGVV